MSSVNNWAAINGGGGSSGGGKSDNTPILLLVLFAGLSCCMLVCALGLWYAHSQGWLDDLFKKKEEDPPAPTPPEEEEEEDDPTEPEDSGPGSGSPLNLTDKSHVCNQPWVRTYLKYDKDGKNPKCCTAADAGYQWSNCQAGDVMEVPKEFPAINVHTNVQRIYRAGNKVLGGKLKRGKCPYNPLAGLNESIWYKETKNGKVQQVWCHPLKTQGQYAVGKGYAFYPACLQSLLPSVPSPDGKADKNADKCTKGSLVWREGNDKVFGGIDNRFKYVA